MLRKGLTPGQIVNKLREANIRTDEGIAVASNLDDFTTRDDLCQWYHRQTVTVNSLCRLTPQHILWQECVG